MVVLRHKRHAILDAVLRFAGSTQQSDDIALAVLMRKAD
jgi:serine phosphatase RsbU (regulator of sigma subunit)